MVKKLSIYFVCLKISTLIVAIGVTALISTPIPVCWDESEFSGNTSGLSNVSSLLPNGVNGQICVPTILFKNIMCAGDPWDNPWWRMRITNPTDFCMARTSTYSGMFIQLLMVGLVVFGHFGFLLKRSFTNFDPLDMVPAFFTISAFSSVLIVQLMLLNGWDEVWRVNNLPPPSAPLRHETLTVVLAVGLSISVLEWFSYYLVYNREQDLMEKTAAAARIPKGSGSDKEHEE